MMRFAVLCALTLSLAAAPARADRILIAGGGKTPEEAQAALKALVVPTVLKLAAGAPRVVKSDDVAGLNPGFHIVVVGQCKDAARAAAALDVLRVFNPGAYAKDVKTSAPDAECPTLQASPIPRDGEVHSTHAVRKGVDAVQWALVEIPSRERGPCAIASQRIEVRRGRQLLESQNETPTCYEPSGDGDLGMSTTPSVSTVDVGEHTFVEVSRTTWAADHGSSEGEVLAFCATTGITSIVKLPGWMGAAVSTIEAVEPQPDPARPIFAVLEGGEESSRHRFIPERCAVEAVAAVAPAPPTPTPTPTTPAPR